MKWIFASWLTCPRDWSTPPTRPLPLRLAISRFFLLNNTCEYWLTDAPPGAGIIVSQTWFENEMVVVYIWLRFAMLDDIAIAIQFISIIQFSTTNNYAYYAQHFCKYIKLKLNFASVNALRIQYFILHDKLRNRGRDSWLPRKNHLASDKTLHSTPVRISYYIELHPYVAYVCW